MVYALPALGHLVAQHDSPEPRWAPLLVSECRTGKELTRAWEQLQQEAQVSADYLEEEVAVEFLLPVEGVGENRTDGTTRKIITERRDQTQGKVILKALENHPDRFARPVLVWRQLDKLSSSWLLSLPGPHSGLSSPIFSEAVCSHLCLPSPASYGLLLAHALEPDRRGKQGAGEEEAVQGKRREAEEGGEGGPVAQKSQGPQD